MSEKIYGSVAEEKEIHYITRSKVLLKASTFRGSVFA